MSQPTILIADDDRTQCDLTQTSLKSAGFNVLIAHDGSEAVSLASQNSPDVTLLDIDFKERLNGDDILEQLRARRVRTRVVMITAAAEADFVKYLRKGAVDFLQKPVSGDQVLAAIRRAVLLEPTLDVAFAEPVEQNQRLLAENAQLKQHIEELDQRLAERGARRAERERAVQQIKHLESENTRLKGEIAALSAGLKTAERSSVKRQQLDLLFTLLIKSAYAVVALVLMIVLVRFANLSEGLAVGIMVIAVLIILLLPLDKATRFSAKGLKSEAHVEMKH